MGRTGKVWGYENFNVEPDVITSAKVGTTAVGTDPIAFGEQVFKDLFVEVELLSSPLRVGLLRHACRACLSGVNGGRQVGVGA